MNFIVVRAVPGPKGDAGINLNKLVDGLLVFESDGSMGEARTQRRSGSRRFLPLGIVLTESLREAVAIHRKPRRTPSATFREVMLASLGPGSAGGAIEVTWPNGETVRFGAGTEAAWIGAVLEAVHRAC